MSVEHSFIGITYQVKAVKASFLVCVPIINLVQSYITSRIQGSKSDLLSPRRPELLQSSGLKYPKVFDKKVKISQEIQKLDFLTESSDKIKCMVGGLASWLAQPNM